MNQHIIHHQGVYNIWISGQGAAFLTGVGLSDIKKYLPKHNLHDRLVRAHAYGTSYPGQTLGELIRTVFEDLTEAEFIAAFLTIKEPQWPPETSTPP